MIRAINNLTPPRPPLTIKNVVKLFLLFCDGAYSAQLLLGLGLKEPEVGR